MRTIYELETLQELVNCCAPSGEPRVNGESILYFRLDGTIRASDEVQLHDAESVEFTISLADFIKEACEQLGIPVRIDLPDHMKEAEDLETISNLEAIITSE